MSDCAHLFSLTSVVQLEGVELAACGLGAHIPVDNLGAELIQSNRVVQWFAMDKRSPLIYEEY